MIRHMRHGSPPRLMAPKPIWQPNVLESYATPSAGDRITPQIYRRGQPRGSGLGQRRWPVERSNAGGLENKRLALRYDRLGFIIQSLLQVACIFLVARRLARQC